MLGLSKSKLITYRLCPKRLWLQEHLDQARASEPSAAIKRKFEVGNQVGDIARKLYDPRGKGEEIGRHCA